MEQIIRCQSCGMPLGDGFFGTEQDGSDTQEFCKFCYQDGTYVQPDVTMESMIQMSIDNMMSEFEYEEEHARALASEFIPSLKRWSK